MYNFKIIDYKNVLWKELDKFGDRNVYQTKSWIDFISKTQKGESIIIEIYDNDKLDGYFSGLIIKKLGFTIFRE